MKVHHLFDEGMLVSNRFPFLTNLVNQLIVYVYISIYYMNNIYTNATFMTGI